MKKDKWSQRLFIVASLMVMCFAFASSASAVRVYGPFLDEATQGNWQRAYGECFYLVPWTTGLGEMPLGDDTVCEGGLLLEDNLLAWKLYMDNDQNLFPFVWYFDPTNPKRITRGGDQWNPCADKYLGATFDNHISSLYDPLASELRVTWNGSLTIAYYFLEELVWCRSLDYVLLVNGVPMKNGTICDFDRGKYIVFKLTGLRGESTIKLDVYNNSPYSLAPCCAGQTPPQGIASENVHLSGVFVSDCFQGCTPGYWKQPQHFESWVDYATTQTFYSVFSRTITIKWSSGCKPRDVVDPTLLQALNANGGGINVLARHGVAALLNASNPHVYYHYSVSEVVEMVQDAIDGIADMATVARNLERANESNCPLN
ncbi:MAG: hypothetical protein AB1442_05670 [Nitrospirota bacterium]